MDIVQDSRYIVGFVYRFFKKRVFHQTPVGRQRFSSAGLCHDMSSGQVVWRLLQLGHDCRLLSCKAYWGWVCYATKLEAYSVRRLDAVGHRRCSAPCKEYMKDVAVNVWAWRYWKDYPRWGCTYHQGLGEVTVRAVTTVGPDRMELRAIGGHEHDEGCDTATWIADARNVIDLQNISIRVIEWTIPSCTTRSEVVAKGRSNILSLEALVGTRAIAGRTIGTCWTSRTFWTACWRRGNYENVDYNSNGKDNENCARSHHLIRGSSSLLSCAET